MKLGQWEQCVNRLGFGGCSHRYWIGDHKNPPITISDRIPGQFRVKFYDQLANLNPQIQNEPFSTVEEAKEKVDELVERFLKLSSFL